jgi:squalene synthase HpnC
VARKMMRKILTPPAGDMYTEDRGMYGQERAWLASRVATLTARRARQENFPVASRLLAASARRDLLDIYVLARLIDDVGDEAPGDRLALLDIVDAEIARLGEGGDGKPNLAPVAALASAVRERGLPLQPFHDLVEANRMDQKVTSYADLPALRGYCRLSAEPVGRLVLGVWGLTGDGLLSLSDDVCTGLQIAEHLQDVGEDLDAGRIYLPQDLLARHEVTPAMLATPTDALTPAGRVRIAAAYRELAGEARLLLAAAAPLAARVPGVARVAVAGFGAGGLAALDAVVAAGASAVRVTPRPKKHRVVWHTVRTLAVSRRSR